MKNSSMKIFGTAVVSAIAIGAIGLTGGCKSQEILKDRPYIPAPSNQEPALPPVAAPVVVAPVVVQPAPTPAPAPAPAPVIVKPTPVETVVPK